MPVFVSEDGRASSELSHKEAQKVKPQEGTLKSYHLGLSDFKPFLTGFSCFFGSVVAGVVVVVVVLAGLAGAG